MLNTYLPVLFEMYKNLYDTGVYNVNNLKFFVQIGTLSEDNYHKIVGDKDEEAAEVQG